MVGSKCLFVIDKYRKFFLQAKAQSELTWIKKVEELSKGNTVLIEWKNL